MDLFIKSFLPNPTSRNIKEVFHNDGAQSAAGNSLTCYMTINSSVDSDDLSNLSKFVWNGILEEFVHYEGSVLEGLKKSLKVGVAKVRELLRHNQELIESGVNFELTLVSIVQGSLYIALLGEHDVVIFRDNERISIAQLFRDHKVNAGSAAIYPTDVIMVTQDDKGISWSDPVALLDRLESGRSDEEPKGLLLLSQEVNFDQLLEGKDLEPIVKVEQEEQPAVEKEPQPDESSPYLEDLDGQDSDLEIDNETPLLKEDEEVKEETDVSPAKMATLNKMVKAGEKLEKVSPAVKKAYEVTKSYLSKGFALLSWLIEKLGAFIQKIVELIFNIADGKFGRQPWFKRIRAKMTQTRIGGGSLGQVRLGDYTQKQQRSKRLAIIAIIIAAIVFGAWGVKQTKEAAAARERHAQYLEFATVIQGYVQDAKDSVHSDKDGAEIALFNASEEYEALPYDKALLSPEDLSAYEDLNDEILTVEDQLFNREEISEGNGMEVLVDAKLSFGSKSSPTDIAIKKDNLLNENLYVTDSGEAALFVITTAGSVSRVTDSESILKSPMFVDVGVEGA